MLPEVPNPTTLPQGARVLVAMSGGVDSSVAAALLVRAGFECVGVFMRLGDVGESLEPAPRERCRPGVALPLAQPARVHRTGCCSIGDANDARLVADELGIPFYVANFRKDFGRVIDYFVDAYAAGQTPNPCVRCNDWLKFGRLHSYAQQLGCRAVASGHYARVEHDADRSRMLRGVHHDKDQSYVLFGVPRPMLPSMLLPIGSHTKPQIRALAQQFGLPTFDKPESQEICFVPDNDYARLVESRRPDVAGRGPIVDIRGQSLGEHRGQHTLTVGQRRGIGVALGRPAFVVAKDARTNTVVVGEERDLDVRTVEVGEANWLDPDALAAASSGRLRCVAQYRAHGSSAAAYASVLPDTHSHTPSGRPGRFRVEFDQPQRAVAPGQAIVLYGDGGRAPEDQLLGGGWIERSMNA